MNKRSKSSTHTPMRNMLALLLQQISEVMSNKKASLHLLVRGVLSQCFILASRWVFDKSKAASHFQQFLLFPTHIASQVL